MTYVHDHPLAARSASPRAWAVVVGDADHAPLKPLSRTSFMTTRKDEPG